MRIESLCIKNYKIFKDIFIKNIPNMVVYLNAMRDLFTRYVTYWHLIPGN